MIGVEMVSFFGKSDLGKNQSNNEDAFIAQSIWDDQVVLAAAIDGVGGYEGGEIAASIAEQTIVEYLNNFPNGERADLIKQAVVEANNAINIKRVEDGKHPNMSCVMTAVLVDIKNGFLHMAHIGDTRLYQYTDGKITKLSHDHSLVGYREEIGELTEEEAMNHPQRNVIGRDAGSQYLDINTDLVETASFPLQSDSTYILCSDGLSDMLTSSMMVEILNSNSNTEEKVNALIDKANEEGGKDNITVVLIDYTGPTTIVQEPPFADKEETSSNAEQEEKEDEMGNEQEDKIEDKQKIIKEINQEEKQVEMPEEKTHPQQIININLRRLEIILSIIAGILFIIMGILGYFLYLIVS